MIGRRLRTANKIAKKRYKRKVWNVPEFGCLRKNNTVCSCQMCCNPRRCGWSSGKERLTVQERKFLLTNEDYTDTTVLNLTGRI